MNYSKEKTQVMRTQKPEIRITNMNEVELGYSKDEAVKESQRCLNCVTKPCVQGCPVSLNIPSFLKETSEGNFENALKIIEEDSLFPAICGRVCPQEKQCQKNCTVGKMHKDVRQSVAIGRVERFLADYNQCSENISKKTVKPSKKVAVVGSGPAGVSCAADLLKMGYEVHIYEALHKLGGVLVYGIPEFRLPKKIVQNELKKVESLGAVIHLDTLVGRTVTIEQLIKRDGFDAVFIASGAGLPNFLNIKGENAVGVVSANEYLSRVNLMKAYESTSRTPIQHSENVVVFGAGNVAMDASRTALRMGAKNVTIVYRRSEEEIPARSEEVIHAREEGVKFMLLHSPNEILTDENGYVKGVVVNECRLTEPDESGRRRPEVIKDKIKTIPCTLVIVAIGNSSAPLIPLTTPEIKTNQKGNFIVNPDTLETSLKGVFAGGDIVLGAATVILAMGQGRKAAKAINDYLKK